MLLCVFTALAGGGKVCRCAVKKACVSITSDSILADIQVFVVVCSSVHSCPPPTLPLWLAVGIKCVPMVAASQYHPWRRHHRERENLQQP